MMWTLDWILDCSIDDSRTTGQAQMRLWGSGDRVVHSVVRKSLGDGVRFWSEDCRTTCVAHEAH